MNKCLNCGKPAKNKFCSISCATTHKNYNMSDETRKKLSDARKRQILKRIEVKKTCEKCGSIFAIERVVNKDGTQRIPKKEKRFCSRSCANGHIVSKETKEKIHKSLFGKSNKNWKGGRKKYTCVICGKKIGKNKYNACRDCYTKIPLYRENQSKALKGKSGGLRPGGGYSKQIEYISSFGEIMKLNNEEIRVAIVLDKLGIKWKRNWDGFPYITLEGNHRKYYPDFYLVEFNYYLEYKGFIIKEMKHKMLDAVKTNKFNLLIIYGNDKRYKDLGLNLKQIEDDPKLIIERLKT